MGREEARGGNALQHPSLCPRLIWDVKTIAKPLANLCDVRFVQSKSDHVSEIPFVCPIRDPSASPQGVNKVSRNPNQRIRSLSLLVQQIKTYYQVRLVRSPLCLRPGLSEQSAGICQPLPSVRCSGAGSASVPADQLVLLKSRALNIGRVHICVIGTGRGFMGRTFCIRTSKDS